MDKQTVLSVADSSAEQTAFADASVTSIWLFLLNFYPGSAQSD